MGKKAVLIGINYPGTENELQGCINDVQQMHSCLLQHYGFREQDIALLIDTDPSYPQPTGKNIRQALDNLVSSAKPGDELFVHYSGHGFRLPAETGDIDDTGFDECIVPCDINLITDEDFKELVCQVHDGCRITIVSDSCHSGGLISGLKEQIGESTISHHHGHQNVSSSESGLLGTVEESVKDAFGYVKSKSLPLSTFINMLKEQTENDDIDVGNIRHTLFDVFGDDASPKVKKFMKIIFHKLHHVHHGGEGSGSGGMLSNIGGLAMEFLKQKLDDKGEEYTKPAMEMEVESAEEVYAGKTKRVLPRNGILLSGCQTDETSADARPSENASDAYGAFSNAIQIILNDSKGKISNQEIVLKARKLLEDQGFTQRPGLYCSDDNVTAPFVC